MPETCENCFGIVSSCVCYARETLEMYQVLPCPVDIKAPYGQIEIHWVQQYLVDVDRFRIKDLWTSEMTVKLESNVCVLIWHFIRASMN